MNCKSQSRLWACLLIGAITALVALSLLASPVPSTGEEASPTYISYLANIVKPHPPTPTPVPYLTPVPGALNWLPNPSFEEGWYHPDGIQELQVPNSWLFDWDEGENPLDSSPWNVFVRPESRLLNKVFLPPEEHDLFIWDGDYTVKIFKGYGSVSFRLTTNVPLAAGSYLFQINLFPDLVVGYTDDGEKIWAPDPHSGEVRFIVNGPVRGDDGLWILPVFGQKNTLQYVFTVTEARVVEVGMAFRGRWAIQNNGWFMDDWSLTALATG